MQRRWRVPPPCVAPNPRQDLLVVPFDEPQASFGVDLQERGHVLRVDPAARVAGVSGLPGVVGVFVTLIQMAAFGKRSTPPT